MTLSISSCSELVGTVCSTTFTCATTLLTTSQGTDFKVGNLSLLKFGTVSKYYISLLLRMC